MICKNPDLLRNCDYYCDKLKNLKLCHVQGCDLKYSHESFPGSETLLKFIQACETRDRLNEGVGRPCCLLKIGIEFL